MINRARQFIPYNTITGFKEALREKEIEQEERRELSDEELEKISDMIHRLDFGYYIKIKYYNLDKRYEEITGKIRRIDRINKKIYVDNKKINFIDIVNINII